MLVQYLKQYYSPNSFACNRNRKCFHVIHRMEYHCFNMYDIDIGNVLYLQNVNDIHIGNVFN